MLAGRKNSRPPSAPTDLVAAWLVSNRQNRTVKRYDVETNSPNQDYHSDSHEHHQTETELCSDSSPDVHKRHSSISTGRWFA